MGGKRITIGDEFGWLVVIEKIAAVSGAHGKARCICRCGEVCEVQISNLRNGHSSSCGCKKRIAGMTHGKSSTREYRAWIAMRDRCTRKTSKQFADYGGRGISYDPAWNSFDKFYEDMGECGHRLTLDRKNTNGGYCKANCKWSTRLEQSTNTRTSKRWVVDGVEYSSARLAAESLGVSEGAIRFRCVGRVIGGRTYAPKVGYSASHVYPAEAFGASLGVQFSANPNEVGR